MEIYDSVVTITEIRRSVGAKGGFDVKLICSIILVGILGAGCSSMSPPVPYSTRFTAITRAELFYAGNGDRVIVSSPESLRQLSTSFAFTPDTDAYRPNPRPRTMVISCLGGDMFVVLGSEQMRMAPWRRARTRNQWRYSHYKAPSPLIECFDGLFEQGQSNQNVQASQ